MLLAGRGTLVLLARKDQESTGPQDAVQRAAHTVDMPVRLHHIVIDAHDLPGLARFWTQALGWKVLSEREDEIVIGTDQNSERFSPAAVPVAYWAPFFLAPVVPGTAVDDPPYPVKRVAGVPVSLLGAAATTATAAAGWFIDRRSTGFQVSALVRP